MAVVLELLSRAGSLSCSHKLLPGARVRCWSAGRAPAGPEGHSELSKAQGGAVVPGCSYKKPRNCLPSW